MKGTEMNTRKYPRTLEEAFGPYARGPVQERFDPMPKADKIVLAVSIVAAVFLICAVSVGWIV
jgi:hypothetical protein